MKRLHQLALMLALAAWLPLIAEWVTLLIPSARTESSDGASPAYVWEFLFLTLPLTLLLAGFAIAVGLGARTRRAVWTAAGAVIALGITFAGLVLFSSYVG